MIGDYRLGFRANVASEVEERRRPWEVVGGAIPTVSETVADIEAGVISFPVCMLGPSCFFPGPTLMKAGGLHKLAQL
ncbi:hypothetical protein Acr_28g0006540 [Actinidia rufa]|uniref:Uncharacterized protein n=1 Tax=Actinidia rufa TaxID=165716 RepID=A0A7J0HA55_9ERIC|nr:hypothetical protein Acr_28g0006540 [Actinidia rufa]